MLEIECREIRNTDVVVPGSKSFTHRILIASALSDGRCEIENALISEDTTLTMKMLAQLGIPIDREGDKIIVQGRSGAFDSTDQPIYLANSGTSMRLLSGIAAAGSGRYLLQGTERMHERPIQDLLDGLKGIGADAVSLNDNGNPPVVIHGKKLSGGSISLDLSLSSQFLSSVLLIAPYTEQGVTVTVPKDPVSKPYIDLTVDIMDMLGVRVDRDGYKRFSVAGGQIYRSGNYAVEPDCSQASYFWGAAAVTGKSVKVKNISTASRQGDVGFAGVLEKMGCRVDHEKDGIAVTGGRLRGIEVDMANMPDVVPTLAVVAAFAEGTTVVKNVAHLKEKECDRLGSVATELVKMGIEAKATESGLEIKGGAPSGSVVKTYDDHRMAMAFSIAGLRVKGMMIEEEGCVVKSFPNYWDVFKGLYQS